MSTSAASRWPTLVGAARDCLQACETDRKVELTRAAVTAWRDGRLLVPATDPDAFEPMAHSAALAPGLPAALRLVDPRSVPRRRLGSARGRAAFVHAIAHIELNAVNLAWDCVHRFRGLPRAYYDDWVGVAGEEAEHFELLRARLGELGFAYGDFQAHAGLWEMAAKTSHDVLARMAMVPRVLEARGLDVTPGLIERLSRAGDQRTADILGVILEQEVGHVATGSRWFRYECGRRGLEPLATFERLLRIHLGGAVKPPLNVAARRRAGFDDAELAILGRLADTDARD